MHVIASPAEFRHAARTAPQPLVLVPTMGALHDGHRALVRRARELAGPGGTVAVSIFVNPIQFDRPGDLAAYPQTLEADLAACEADGADLVFTPEPAAMYFPDRSVTVTESSLSGHLCGAARPGHFDGVCTVVLKLFHLVQPDIAIFGKKDRQQLKIVRGMVQQFNMRIQIVPAETVRAEDGLALSSRNNYLSPAERAEAPSLYRVLRGIADAIAGGRTDYANLEAAGRMELANRGWKVDYVAIRHGLALRIPHPEGYDHPNLLIVLAAATLGNTRLIDNVDVIKKDGED